MKRAHLTAASLALGLAAGQALAASDLPYHGKGPMMTTPDALAWSPVASMAPGAEITIIEGSLKEKAPFTLRLRMPDGYRIAPHTHPAYERVTVLSGTLHFAHGNAFDKAATTPLPAGSVAIMPPGAPMFGYTEGETVIQLHGEGPWGLHYLDSSDDPRS